MASVEPESTYEFGSWRREESGFLPNGRRWSDRYDYDARYLENGMSYVILPETKEEQFTFGIAWINNVEDDHARDVQTWFAADITMD